VKSALCVFAAALPLVAQPKLLVNAKLDTRSAAAGLDPAFRALLNEQPQPAWIGYSVPSVRSYGLGCEYVRDNPAVAGVVHLEPPDHAVILFRIEENAVNRVRTLSPDCEIDAGGVPVHWLSDVQPAQSVALLVSMIPERGQESLVSSIAQHSDPAADQALEKFLAPTQQPNIRMRATSGMQYRGHHGFEILKNLIANDSDERVRERAVFALSNMRETEAFDLLLSLARNDPNARVRQHAISSLGRKPGATVIPVLTKAIESDPDPQVKYRAIATLQSLPDGAGIPVLIELVKGTQNPEIRKRAMSHLQGSRDPRAVSFFEDILKR
jgi:hypothetical protein